MKSFVCLAGAAMLAGAVPASASILTFDIAGGVSDFENLPQTYGDRVTASPDGNGHSYGFGAEGGTANVMVDYGTPGEDPALWTTGYGDLTNIHFNDADGDTTFTLRFTADAGYTVDLYGFDLASYLTGGQTIQGFTVRDFGANTVLFSQGEAFITGNTRNSFSFAPVSANQLEIVIDLTGLGGVSDDIGIDNVRFGQTLLQAPVPEPASWAMMIAGFAMAGLGARHRSRRALSA